MYEKRKVAALEIEKSFALSQHPHSRKGGLIGLAACSIALGKLAADPGPNVKSGSELLDRLLKVKCPHQFVCEHEHSPCAVLAREVIHCGTA
ncbi:unnamed protein product [Ranitomeya imitator]|uniref:Uncharacterized protein n=1 Tax=Ranitomeya imitator TaxID=111125 RepID=A0ABN9MBA2_9NEOB|nr:unnamed protein product [Ranitomeya imitator]